MYPPIVYSFLFCCYYSAISLLVVFPVLFLRAFLKEYEIAQVILTPVVYLGIFWLLVVVPYLVHTASWARKDMGYDFYDSVEFGWNRLKMALSVIPIVGRFFEDKEEPGDPPSLE